MNQPPIDVRDRGAPGRQYAREDSQQRDIVDHGIQMQLSSNTMSAVEYLKSRDVRPHVIARVLLEPDRRRGNDD